MRLNRLFYDSRLNLKSVPLIWFIISFIVGLFSALTIYSFFYVIRESFRVMTFGFANLPYIITEEDRNLYNLFFAGLSVIFSNSITINMLLSRPSNATSRRNPMRKRILNDQVFLNFNFSYWFAKMGLCFFVFSMCCMDFDFSPYVGFLSTLLLLVLYLDSWKGISRIFNKNRFKFQLINFATLILLSFGLSSFDIIDYKSIDELAIKSCSIYDLPHSDFHNAIYTRYSREINLKIELLDRDELRIIHYGKWGAINDIPDIIAAERTSIREEMTPFLSVRISADKNIDLKYVKMVEAKLYSINQQKIIYNIYNDDLLTHRFENRGIKYRISPFLLKFKKDNSTPFPPLPFQIDTIKPEKIFKIKVNKRIRVDGEIVPEDSLVDEFKKQINKLKVFEYTYDENTKYKDYITVLSSHYRAVYELRKQNQTIFKAHKYDNREAFLDEQYKLKQQFPMHLIEKFD